MARAEEVFRDPVKLGLADPGSFRRRIREMGATGTDDELDAIRRGWIADVEAGRRGFRVHPSVTLQVLRSAVEKVRPMIAGRRWELLRLTHSPGFILGDQPVTLFQGGRIAPSVGFGTPGVQVMMPLSPATLLLISDAPREPKLRVIPEPVNTGLREPWWSHANKVAWLSSARYVWAQRRIHLEMSELLLTADRRRQSGYDLG